MPVTLASASDARIDFGDLASLAGVGELTFALTVTPSGTLASRRFFTQWAASGTDQAFICGAVDTDELGFCVAGNGTFKGRKTTALNMASGTTYRMVLRWLGSVGGNTLSIFVNGSSPSVTTWIADGSPTNLNNSTCAVQIGHETKESQDGEDGDYSEFAIWLKGLSNESCLAISKGFSPRFFRRSADLPIIYAPLENTSTLIDLWSNNTVTNSSGTNGTTTGRLYSPRPARLGDGSGAAAATAFPWLYYAQQRTA